MSKIPYNHKAIEKKWREKWEENPVNVQFDEDGNKKEKYYCLDMFPYPSGNGLHVGHWRGYVISDVWSRYKLQQGYYPPEIIEQAIEYVAGFHYIDDLRYAVDYITYHENSRSRRRIEQDLQGKGISSATIEEAWQSWRENGGEQDEQSMIRELLRKKHYDAAEETDWKERQKIYAFLARKGFSQEAIRKAIGGMHSDEF